jgi:hypothetical protein
MDADDAMTTIEFLLGLAAVLASLSGAMVAFVLWIQRPRYRRRSWTRRGMSPSALSASSPSRPDEGSFVSVRAPRMRTEAHGVPVADVEDDTPAGSAEVQPLLTR